MYGIIGYPLLQTFSPGYFNAKFERLGLPDMYHKFPLTSISMLRGLLASYPELKGLNVTIPYKQDVIALLDEMDETAEKIGAVNTIRIKNGKLKGYNTDTIGFRNSLEPMLKAQHNKALILGTGGAAKAVAHALEHLGISFYFVSRNKTGDQLSYADLGEDIVKHHKLIINTTPLGMTPNEHISPDIPYKFLSSEHLLYDLVYYPEETLFLQKARKQQAGIKNGYEMLIGQAEAAWEIWQRG